MNNFVNFARKFKRGGLERRAVWAADNALPHVEQYISSHRYPVLPKIVVYSSLASSDAFLQK